MKNDRKKQKAKKKGKKKVSRRAFAATSVIAAATPSLIGCDNSETAESNLNESALDASSSLQMGGKPRRQLEVRHDDSLQYYTDPKHFLNDEKYLAKNLWLMVDHHSRIPDAGDYFTFEFGRGENIIILRDENETRLSAFRRMSSPSISTVPKH